jgi:hypothetical protein
MSAFVPKSTPEPPVARALAPVPEGGFRAEPRAAGLSALGSFGAYLPGAPPSAALQDLEQHAERPASEQALLLASAGDGAEGIVDLAPAFLAALPPDLIVPDGLPMNDVIDVVLHARIDRIRHWFERNPQPLRGCLDDVTASGVFGWAQNPARPEAPVCLDVVLDGVVVAQGLANHHRVGLAEAGFGSGCHAFAIPLDEPLTPAQLDRVEVRRSGDGVLVGRSRPVAITGPGEQT